MGNSILSIKQLQLLGVIRKEGRFELAPVIFFAQTFEKAYAKQ